MKVSMTKCSGFSTHQTLFDVFQVFRKVVANYVERLNMLLPSMRSSSAPLDRDGVQEVCCIIGTAEYCDETLPQLAESLLRGFDSTFEERVSFESEKDEAQGVAGSSEEGSARQVFAVSHVLHTHCC